MKGRALLLVVVVCSVFSQVPNLLAFASTRMSSESSDVFGRVGWLTPGVLLGQLAALVVTGMLLHGMRARATALGGRGYVNLVDVGIFWLPLIGVLVEMRTWRRTGALVSSAVGDEALGRRVDRLAIARAALHFSPIPLWAIASAVTTTSSGVSFAVLACGALAPIVPLAAMAHAMLSGLDDAEADRRPLDLGAEGHEQPVAVSTVRRG